MEETVEMIDLHSHILSGLDDGPKTIEESIWMCQVSYRDGVRTLVATPHTLNGLYYNDRRTILSKVEELNVATRQFGVRLPAQTGGLQFDIQNSSPMTTQKPDNPITGLKILPGADVHLSEVTLPQVDLGEVMTIGDRKKYILVEFPYQGIPFRAEKILFGLMARGMTPIISHPERNMEIGTRPGRYVEMIRMGCLGQLTGMSLTGELGSGVKQVAETLLSRRLIHLIASDGHSVNGRPPILSTGVKAAARIVGREEAMKMVTEYPQAILEGRRPSLPDPLPL